MKPYRPRSTLTKRTAPPDLVNVARTNMGEGADACTVADSLFDAAFRSVKGVQDTPRRNAMLNRVLDKAYAELVTPSGGNGAAYAPTPRAAEDHRGKAPEPKNKPGLAVPERPRR